MGGHKHYPTNLCSAGPVVQAWGAGWRGEEGQAQGGRMEGGGWFRPRGAQWRGREVQAWGQSRMEGVKGGNGGHLEYCQQ